MNTKLNPEFEPNRFTLGPDGGEIVSAHGIGMWLMEARERGATHMVVVCDTFDHTDYPVEVMPEEDVHQVVEKYRGSDMQRVMEVYWVDGDLNEQLNANRCFNYGPEDVER